MDETFLHDVFLSHSSKDKATVREIAERLRADGLRVWLDEWVLKPSDSIAAKIEEGLERSRVLVLCMSADAFGSDWARLESYTFRFRDPLNKERRFIPLRLDETPIPGALAQFLYLDWLPEKQEYVRLLEACQPPAPPPAEAEAARKLAAGKVIQLDYKAVRISDYAFTPNGQRVLTAADDKTMRLWDLETGHCLCVFEGHTGEINNIAWSADGCRALSASDDRTLRLWDIETRHCLCVLEGHMNRVCSVAWAADGGRAVSGSSDQYLRMWNVETGQCLGMLRGHTSTVWAVAWSAHRNRILSGSHDKTVRVWDAETGHCLRVLEGHAGWVVSVAWSADGRLALSGAEDGTIRLWDVDSGHCLRVLEGHMGWVTSVMWNADGRRVLSGSADSTVRLWEMKTGRCLRMLVGHKAGVRDVAWSTDGRHILSGDSLGGIRVRDLSEFASAARAKEAAPYPVQYTNAKVVLVGESGVGKTGLALRLCEDRWEATESTHGMNVSRLALPPGEGGRPKGRLGEGSQAVVEREVWLWDFAGQPDYRLVHQLYMDETALGLMVFDPQDDNPFEEIGYWERALRAAGKYEPAKLLVAARCDRGGVTVSQKKLEEYVRAHGYAGFLSTGAKTGEGLR